MAESSSADENKLLRKIQQGDLSEVTINNIKELKILMQNTSLLENSLKVLRIQFVSLSPFLSKMSRSHMTNLKKLEMNYASLSVFPESILNLKNLKVLDLSNNSINEITPSIANLTNLKRLDLTDNSINEITPLIANLANLQRLYLSFNSISEITTSISKLTKLQRLYLSSNKINDIPPSIANLKSIQRLHLSSNIINEIPSSIGNLTNLQELDLSNNKLTSVPECIGNLHQLKDLNLENNMITILPETICDLNIEVNLNLSGNPLQMPPFEVCENGIQAIKGYFEDTKKSKGTINSKRLKLVLVGESGAGKTSLAKALVYCNDGNVGSDESTIVLDYYNWVIPKEDLQIRIVDCAGQREYLLTHQFFFTKGALFVLVVDLSKYNMIDSVYKTMVGDWMNIVTSQNPGASILVVPTHLDCCKEEDVDINSRCNDLIERLKNEEERQMELLKEKIESVKGEKGKCDRIQYLMTERPKFSTLLCVSEEEYKKTTFGQEDISLIPVCTKGDRKGLQLLRQEILRLAENEVLCPIVFRRIPQKWQFVEETLIELRNSGIQFTSIESLQDKVESKWGISNDMLYRALVYMNAIGSIEFFHNVEQVRHLVFIDPTWFVDLLKLLFRHNHENTLMYKQDFMYKFHVLDGQFKSQKQLFFSKGHLSKALLKCIWLPFYEKDVSFPFDNVVQILSYFGLLCKLENEPSSDEIFYFIPWFVPEEEPGNAREQWEQDVPMSSAKMITTRLETGAAHLPASIICRLLVSVQSKSKLCIPWKKGFLVINKNIKVRCKIVHGEYSSIMTLYGRGADESLREVWQLTLETWKELHNLINNWNGVLLFEIYSLCPFCVQENISNPSQFVLRERSIQDEENTCHHCNRYVDCSLICPSEESGRENYNQTQIIESGRENHNQTQIIGLSRSVGNWTEVFRKEVALKLSYENVICSNWEGVARKLNIDEGKIRKIRDRGDAHRLFFHELKVKKPDVTLLDIKDRLEKKERNDVFYEIEKDTKVPALSATIGSLDESDFEYVLEKIADKLILAGHVQVNWRDLGGEFEFTADDLDDIEQRGKPNTSKSSARLLIDLIASNGTNVEALMSALKNVGRIDVMEFIKKRLKNDDCWDESCAKVNTKN